MRKALPLVMALVAFALPASAQAWSLELHLISKRVDQHRTPSGGFAFKDNLFDRANPSNSVGRDRGRCEELAHAFECHATIFLNGELGGEGTIRVGGTVFRRGDRRLQVTGGTGDFNGVAGKVVLRPRGYDLLLVR